MSILMFCVAGDSCKIVNGPLDSALWNCWPILQEAGMLEVNYKPLRSMFWDEDPRYGEALCRLLSALLAVKAVFVTAWGFIFGEWEMFRTFAYYFAIAVGALSFYAAVVWIVVKSALFVMKTFGRKRDK